MDRESELNALSRALASAKKEALIRETERNGLQELLDDTEKRRREAEKERDLFEKVRVLLQGSAEHARLQAKEQMETLVTNALQYVFGPQFRFEIELSEHGGKSAAEFYVITDWEGTPVKTKPQDARGGGVVDIISLALRVAMVETFRPRPEGPLILDEPGKHVSAEYVLPMLEFLKATAEMFGRQVILVSHNSHLTEGADRVFQVQMRGGETLVRIPGVLDNEAG